MNSIALIGKYGQILRFPCHKSLFTSKFKGGRIAHFEGGRPFGDSCPTHWGNVPPASPRALQKGDVGKRFPRRPLVPGAWGARGARTQPWGTRPRGTLLKTILPFNRIRPTSRAPYADS